ncbi:hypothetical protein [Flavobacterium facile]|uniref:hypothetical protein n=1 Tax=Flavobacterium facile TaxID=2893174 RepID=UPI002E794C48|nr:hypothetical protein [Flavobacterium sp. T-12]
MKIDLKITFSQLEVLVLAFSVMTEPPIQHRDTKVARSVLDKVMIKIKKKHIDESVKSSLFSQKKKFKLSFEYYEAHFLEKFLEIILSFSHEDYERTVITIIMAELNQKLT